MLPTLKSAIARAVKEQYPEKSPASKSFSPGVPSSFGEEAFLLHLKVLRLPTPLREFYFAEGRRWRFDFAWPDRKMAVEIEGGLGGYGRHQRKAGYEADLEKYNEAAFLGWRVYRFSTGQVTAGDAVRFMERVFGR